MVAPVKVSFLVGERGWRLFSLFFWLILAGTATAYGSMPVCALPLPLAVGEATDVCVDNVGEWIQ